MNAYSNILFVWSVVSFILQNGFTNWMKSKIWVNCLKKPCLWNISTNEYTKREVKERAYAELVEHFESLSAIVKAKINALRVQLSWKMARESKTSCQAIDQKYVSKWMFYEQFRPLRPVMATTKSQDSISTRNKDLDDSVSFL